MEFTYWVSQTHADCRPGAHTPGKAARRRRGGPGFQPSRRRFSRTSQRVSSRMPRSLAAAIREYRRTKYSGLGFGGSCSSFASPTSCHPKSWACAGAAPVSFLRRARTRRLRRRGCLARHRSGGAKDRADRPPAREHHARTARRQSPTRARRSLGQQWEANVRWSMHQLLETPEAKERARRRREASRCGLRTDDRTSAPSCHGGTAGGPLSHRGHPRHFTESPS